METKMPDKLHPRIGAVQGTWEDDDGMALSIAIDGRQGFDLIEMDFAMQCQIVETILRKWQHHRRVRARLEIVRDLGPGHIPDESKLT